jgi:HD-GYP domain-containing protein (c-di-GMP phosphodiesterase class II)
MKGLKRTNEKLISAICNAIGVPGSQSERKAIGKLINGIKKDSGQGRIEKRKHIRAKVRGYIIAKIKGDYANNIMRVLCISYGGALLESMVAMQEGQILDLNIYLPSYSKPILVKSRVARVVPGSSFLDTSSPCFHVGVEFFEISSESKERLMQTVNSLIMAATAAVSKDVDLGMIRATNPTEYYSLLRKKYFNHTIRTLIYIMDSIDKFNYRHSENVVRHVEQLGNALSLSHYEILKIKIAALMHDLGKFRIQRKILYKPGKLTTEEWGEIKKHPIISAAILNETGILNEVSKAVKHHHEKFGGGGYPDPTKKGIEIPLTSRIIAVADSYDAMVSKRPYRDRRMSKKEALAEIKRCTGTQFDPKIVAAFVPAC